MFKKILWGYDDSDDSIRAFEFVKLLSKEYNSDVTGISVLPFYIEILSKSQKSKKFYNLDDVYDWIEDKFVSAKRKEASQISNRGQLK